MCMGVCKELRKVGSRPVGRRLSGDLFWMPFNQVIYSKDVLSQDDADMVVILFSLPQTA